MLSLLVIFWPLSASISLCVVCWSSHIDKIYIKTYFYLSEPPTYERIFYSRSSPDRDVYDIESDHGLDGEPLAPENTVLTLEQNDNGMYCIFV